MEPMAHDPDRSVASSHAPSPFGRPLDAPPPLGRARDLPAVVSLRAAIEHQAQHERGPARRQARGWLRRISGRADRQILASVAQATESLASFCDDLAERMARLEEVASDVNGTLGQEVTLLRAEVLDVQRRLRPPAGE